MAVDLKNVWRWYTLGTIVHGIDQKQQAFEATTNWTVFIAFEKPIKFKQIIVDGFGSSLPRYEVKDSSNRTAIIVFNGDLVATTVEIRAID